MSAVEVFFLIFAMQTAAAPTPAPVQDLAVTASWSRLARPIYLPLVLEGVAVRRATRTPTPRPEPTATWPRPRTVRELLDAVRTPGAYVRPECGPYALGRSLRAAEGVTLDGGGCIALHGRGVEVYRANGVTLRRLVIVRPEGDGISVSSSTGTLIEDVLIQGPAGDGGLDIVHSRDGGGSHVVRNVTIRGVRKAMLLGHQTDADDGPSSSAGLFVLLQGVTFDGGAEGTMLRTPKVHRARVTILGGNVHGWSGPRLDVQLGGRVTMRGTSWTAGRDSLREHYLPTSGSVDDDGSNPYRSWKGGPQ